MRLLFIAPLLFVFITNAQILKTKKTFTACFKEIYTVDVSTNLKCGRFLRLYKQNKDTLSYGNYQNGQKTGIWKYFDRENKLWMVYDFDKKSFVLVPEEISALKSFVVSKGDSFSLEEVDNPPIYLGSKSEIGIELMYQVKIPSEIIQNMKPDISSIDLLVGKDGTIKDIIVEKIQSKDLLSQVKKVLEHLDGEWIPAKVNGEAVDSIIPVIIEINFGGKQLIESSPRCILVCFHLFSVTRTSTMTNTLPVR